MSDKTASTQKVHIKELSLTSPYFTQAQNIDITLVHHFDRQSGNTELVLEIQGKTFCASDSPSVFSAILAYGISDCFLAFIKYEGAINLLKGHAKICATYEEELESETLRGNHVWSQIEWLHLNDCIEAMFAHKGNLFTSMVDKLLNT